MAQWQRVFDLQQGTGTMVIGLASVIVGMSLTKGFSFIRATTAVILGSIIYRGCIAIAIRFGMSANDLKLITAALLFVILVLSREKKKKVAHHA
jgi:putative ABC transport system permease protein